MSGSTGTAAAGKSVWRVGRWLAFGHFRQFDKAIHIRDNRLRCRPLLFDPFYASGILSNESYIGWLRKKVGNGLILSASVGAVIHDRQGRLLLQEKTSGEAWSLPAGGIELGESPQEAIAREVMEETGYAIRIHGILGVFGGRSFRYTYPNGDQVEYVATLFQCRIIGGDGIPRDAETKSTRYFEKHEMPELALPYPYDDLFRAF